MKSFQNLTAVVTGASSGIGREFSIQLADRGAVPVLVARRKQKLDELADEIQRKTGIKALIAACDLTQKDSFDLIDRVLTENDRNCDILVNNAGFGYQGDFTAADPEIYEKMTALNIGVLTSLTRRYLPGMISRGTGGILNVASMAGYVPVPTFAVYAATKTYVIHFSEALWQEVRGSGIHVSCLCPGPVETEFFEVAGMNSDAVGVRGIQKADEVARTGLDALLKNKRLVPSSLSHKISAITSSFVPKRCLLVITQKIMNKQSSAKS